MYIEGVLKIKAMERARKLLRERETAMLTSAPRFLDANLPFFTFTVLTFCFVTVVVGIVTAITKKRLDSTITTY